jgi:hypothetical protein
VNPILLDPIENVLEHDLSPDGCLEFDYAWQRSRNLMFDFCVSGESTDWKLPAFGDF